MLSLLPRLEARYLVNTTVKATCSVIDSLVGKASISSKSMSDSIIVTNITGSRGSSPIIIGLCEYFQRNVPTVGYFVPIYHESEGTISNRVHLIQSQFHLPGPPESMQGVSLGEAEELLASGKSEELLDKIWSKYSEYKKGKDMVVIEGISIPGISQEIELNGKLSAELGAPVLMVMDMKNDDTIQAVDIAHRTQIAKSELKGFHADIAGLILNRVPKEKHLLLTTQMQELVQKEHCAFAGGIPNDPILESPRLNEVMKFLNAQLLYGDPQDLDVDVSQMMIAAQGISKLFSKIEYMNFKRSQQSLPQIRPLIITTPDRVDILLGLASAHLSSMPGITISGVLICDSNLTSLDPHVAKIFDSLKGHIFPVITSETGAYETARRVSKTLPAILSDSHAKISHSKGLFLQHVNMNVISSQLALPKEPKLTPKQFVHKLHALCRSNMQTIVLPEAMDRRILTAASKVSLGGLAHITLLGNPEAVITQARKFNIDISKCNIVDHDNFPDKEKYAEIIYQARKHKGMNMGMALDMLHDINVFGTMMVKTGAAGGMVSGASCTTADTIRPALILLRKSPSSLVSSVFLMCLPETVLVYGDCAINVDPTAEQLADIAATSAQTAASFGVDPRVAMLSYSTLGSGAGPAVDKVQKATSILKDQFPEMKVEGPIQYDAAIDPQVASTKVKENSSVAGKANVFIFPDLNTGNNTYKAVQQSTGALAIGPLIQGLEKPVNDLSRGCTVADIVNTIACTAIQAMGPSKE